MGQPVMQWQILAKEPAKLADFYTKLFAWDVNANNALNYRMIDTGSERGINGGIWPAPPEGHSMVSLYVEVDDVDGYVAKATKLGGKVVMRNRNFRTATRWPSSSILRGFRWDSSSRPRFSLCSRGGRSPISESSIDSPEPMKGPSPGLDAVPPRAGVPISGSALAVARRARRPQSADRDPRQIFVLVGPRTGPSRDPRDGFRLLCFVFSPSPRILDALFSRPDRKPRQGR